MKKKQRADKVGILNYSYNVRGWPILIEDDTFSEKLYYADSKISTPYYNGNISSQIWKNANDGVVRGYIYSYDNMNRLASAMYGEGTSLQNNRNRYTESISSYDKNSSILSLQRYGKKNMGDYGLIDDLHYSMDGNKIRSITDKVGRLQSTGFLDFDQASSGEYTYNGNGALQSDPNKGIGHISYDNLGYPKSILYKDGNNISFDYSCMGEKLSVLHQTDYVGDVIYEQDSPKKILFDGGYYSFSDNLCHYFTRDHLGSVRAVVNENGVLEQALHYYPFGGIYDVSYNADLQSYKYNGKELERIYGLDWYDYGERFYDAAKCSWDRIDKLCESFYHLNPYCYCGENPIRYVDIKGLRPGDFFYTADAAALDFGMCYNGKSIWRNREYGASIFEIVNKRGERGYTYSVPNEGAHDSVLRSDAPKGNRVVASVHSHAGNHKQLERQQYDIYFSGSTYEKDGVLIVKEPNELKKVVGDSDIAHANIEKINAYVATPDGALQKYDYKSGKISQISKNLPSDVKSFYRLNNNVVTSVDANYMEGENIDDYKRIMYEQY